MLQRIDAITGPRPLHGLARTREIEAAALQSVPPFTLMQRAGDAAARLARAMAPHTRRAWVAAGPGNNGGDGLVAAIALRRAGIETFVTLSGDAAQLRGDAQQAHALALGEDLHWVDQPPDGFGRAGDLALDALLGIGASRAPAGRLAVLIDALNALACPVLAIDMPSGLGADTGQPHGEACVTATHTLSLLTLKPGLFTGHGRDCCGEVWLDGLAVDAGPADAWLGASPSATGWQRAHAQHKGSFGDLVVIGGAPGMAGAALLAARAGHAAGAGRTYLSFLDDAGPALDGEHPELMIRRALWKDDLLREATVVCGCGGGDAVRGVLPRVIGQAGRLVLDADALNAIATDTTLRQLLVARGDNGRPAVLTPHPLEAARLLGSDTAGVQADRLRAAQTLADGLKAIVLLKGSGSVIAAPGCTPQINPTGNAALATAGTGDVLAGWIGGRWSAADASSIADVLQTASAAAWQHGRAADLSPTTPLRASDLIAALHAQLRRG
ncbi:MULTISPECIES: bifunctional ADP-dependent NAD(P)H-hydrate dehydratase/NAD(P)H-hydrate epimerase [unclassified Rhizobacter]|uniref:bifunctional ADP-dependent NAD(P)H-hydrate dehydratase/NAD(P)H-hydrate epimerase n=1 Tax=unclassified Rhizobacter TaxID=2640088 RepID=UPI0006F6AEC5|nr:MULTISPECIES: bifunctional ADP-dependent NAD(P)H-hydrate dehydratase/NAD(P)H-hydrate epimerase [unclassified Rhizobacter]KQU66218.1 carbohydrate kinase [Rhizobacter sp. Root29]KQV97963.1 carbohydrate kinase [Rhizobacter sp. Root1238]KRB19104.1 carbohydrate kinase [Rhizobacter sp. Root16D2]